MNEKKKNTAFYTEKNRRAWNEAAPIHKKHRKEDLEAFFTRPGCSTLDVIITKRLLRLPLEGKTVAQICCNNGRELLSLINLGAVKGTGFDISDEFIQEARTLQRISGLDAEFVRTDVFEIPEAYHDRFDLVYISIGVLPWIPDLPRLFQIVAHLLRPGGDLVIYEIHPALNMFAIPGDAEYQHPFMAVSSYFERGPLEGTDGLDYIGGTRYDASPHYEFMYTLSDILNGIIQNGLVLRSLEEFDHDISMIFQHVEREKKLPLCYILHAVKS